MKSIVLQYTPATLLWLATVYKLPAFLRSPRDPGRGSFWFTLFSITLAMTVVVPPVYLGVDSAVGVPNVSRLLSNSLTLIGCWFVQSFLSHVQCVDDHSGREVRRNGWILLAILAAMAALLLTAPVPREALDFIDIYGAAPHILEYRLLYLLCLGLSELTLTRLTWRYARVTDNASLRLGLRIWAVSGPFGLAYVIHDGLYLILLRLGFSYPLRDPARVDEILVALTLGIGAIGMTMPAWGPQLGIPALCRWVSEYRSLRRLYPIWLALYRASPEIAFAPFHSPLSDMLMIHDTSFRLYRRVVEIRDGSLALRPYVDPSVAELARELGQHAQLPPEDIDAVVEAAVLGAAQWAKSHGRPSNQSNVRFQAQGGADIIDEVAMLERVAFHYAHSPIVRAISRQLT